MTREASPEDEQRPTPRRFVPLEVVLKAFRDVPRIDAARFRKDVDAILDQDIEPRA